MKRRSRDIIILEAEWERRVGRARRRGRENREKSKMMPFELRVTDFPFDIELRLNKTRHQLTSTDSSIPLL